MSVLRLNTWYEQSKVGIPPTDNIQVSDLMPGGQFENYKLYYPNIPSGYPSIRLELEEPCTLLLPINWRSGVSKRRYPITWLNNKTYYICIPTYEITFTSNVIANKFVTKLVCKDNDTEIDPINQISSQYRSKTLYVEDDVFNNIQPHEKVYYFDEVNATSSAFTTSNPPTSFNTVKNTYLIEGHSNISLSYMDAAKFKTPTAFNGRPEYLEKMLYMYNIGSSCNHWYILTVDYYYVDKSLLVNNTDPITDILLGTYKCVFNPYIMDLVLNYNLDYLEPETNYHGLQLSYLLQYYDYVNLGLSESLNFNNHYEYLSIGNGTNNWGGNDQNMGLFNSYSGSGYIDGNYTVNFNSFNPNTKLNGSGILYSNPNTWDTTLPTFNDASYLYNIIPQITYSDHRLDITAITNNCGFSTRAKSDSAMTSTYLKNRTDDWGGEFILFPGSLHYSYTFNWVGYLGSYAGLWAINNRSSAPYNTTITNLTTIHNILTGPLAQFNLYLPHNYPSASTGYSGCRMQLDFNRGIVSKNNYQTWNDSSLEMIYDRIVETNVTNASSYTVAPLYNVMCQTDDIVLPGYLTINGVFPSNLKTNYNYLLSSPSSETQLNYNGTYSIEHFGLANTSDVSSIYSKGFTYYDISTGGYFVANLKKGLYYLNFNFVKSSKASNKIQFNVIIQELGSSSTITLSVPLSNKEEYIIVIKKDSLVKIEIINGGINNNSTNIISVTSCGLYEIIRDKGTDSLITNYDSTMNNNLLTNGTVISSNITDITYPLMVYSYYELTSCLDSKHNYLYNGSAFHGYLKTIDTYLINMSVSPTDVIINNQTYTCRQ